MLSDNDLQNKNAQKEEVIRCPKCTKDSVRVHPVEKYQYRESGLDNVLLVGGGVLEYVCQKCAYKGIAVQKEPQLLQVIALDLLLRPALLRGKELRYLRRQCDLTQDQLASKLGVRRGAIIKWEAGKIDDAEHSRQIYLRIVLLREFQRMLSEEGNYLGVQNNERLKTFEREFVAQSEKIFRKPKLKLITLEKHTDWGPQRKEVA
jgi:DNA-binding XRE family transcriptional regulator